MSSTSYPVALSDGRKNFCWFLKNLMVSISSPYDVAAFLKVFMECITSATIGSPLSDKYIGSTLLFTGASDNNIAVPPVLTDDAIYEKLMNFKDNSNQTEFANEIKILLTEILEQLSVMLETTFPHSLMIEALGISEPEALFISRMSAVNSICANYGRIADNLEKLLKKLRNSGNTVSNILAVFMGFTEEDIKKIQQGRLCELGLLKFQNEPKKFFGSDNEDKNNKTFICMSRLLVDVLAKKPENAETLASMLSGRRVAADAELLWEDFSHLGKLRDVAVSLLRERVGGSVLLVGPPGLGKTQFAAVLSREAGIPLFSVGESHEGEEPSRNQRFSALKTAVAVNRTQSALLLDEAEDVLEAPGNSTDRFEFSKAHLNRFLDVLNVPVIWTTNSTRNIDPATLRRMGMVIPFETPNTEVRTRIWNRTLMLNGIADADSATLAREWSAPAGLCATVARTVKLAGVNSSAIGEVLDGFSRVMDIRAKRDSGTFDFDPDLCEAETDIAAMTENLRCADSRAWNMCLYGPPGTGKSAYARYVAAAIGMEVMLKKASDLLDMFVGGTEKNIAEAFRSAVRENKVLIIDEADSMLASRENAGRTWEISQVNEMLTQMESHPLPFFVTTNLMERIDIAALRRFVFKMQFRNLGKERAELAFRRILGMELPLGIRLPEGLSSGDIAPMRKRMKLLNVSDAHTVVKWLHEEAVLKGERRHPIGFG